MVNYAFHYICCQCQTVIEVFWDIFRTLSINGVHDDEDVFCFVVEAETVTV